MYDKLTKTLRENWQVIEDTEQDKLKQTITDADSYFDEITTNLNDETNKIIFHFTVDYFMSSIDGTTFDDLDELIDDFGLKLNPYSLIKKIKFLSKSNKMTRLFNSGKYKETGFPFFKQQWVRVE